MKECSAYDTSRGALPRDVIERPALLGHLSKERVGHPDQKPLSIVTDLILASSNEGQVVLDPFGGSGTTAEACIKTGRKYLLIEKDGKNIEMINKRLSVL
jgi:site-specific DNA-methyltransferase (adenine-specific)